MTSSAFISHRFTVGVNKFQINIDSDQSLGFAVVTETRMEKNA